MNRYGVLSITGYANPIEGGNLPAPTTWYVYDSAECCEIVFTSRHEHAARLEAFRSNAAERAWEKHQEIAARNGRGT